LDLDYVQVALRERDYILPGDVKYVAVACLARRMLMNPESALSGATTQEVLGELLKKVEVPLVNQP
jgi:MoxR-like ATPase